MPRNRDTKRGNRSASRACKPGKWATQERAEAAIVRLEKDHPLDALGVRAYPCDACGLWHVGRGGRYQ
jgi:hypothetical protein